MGRGRAKAKQTKVARQLKYFSPETDYEALQRELHGPDRYSASTRPEADAEGAEEDESADDEDEFDSTRYAVDDDEVDDDYEAWAAKRRA
ncbi:Protein of unknown function (DUF3073) [Kineococcus xinjiangensis]|uniref:DUF3073 family protein n=1 Tax=Kineococcus xinjiangensis TaxID=512762 RepID=A0A2S6IUY0_9ACTN|nr:DUF3073 domain-containing protein [Kineococcus xinjiangensis]PPK97864.1 Protein of unknown function (DUF3073) [Kineococcus xinjiangensis]